ncbi:uncharacterized protein A4U43_C04F10820 [Asparagus officinalis]|uniref:Bifunctional inhibitor/plant lipid transfer protein/seed storage helical domain-containing protein n=1 Tax=Asparagus officinalis TaxID=4686 RepID=A0A5P1F4R1_ASPOF|nr:uncharacterized protein A4U43_C04F10820 [Asparagus officinalis]
MALSLQKNTMAMVMLIALLLVSGSAQKIPECVTKLVPCAAYLNSTQPPESCCKPLKDELTNDLPCLCSIFKDEKFLKSFNIDLNSVLQLPKNCGVLSFSINSSCSISPAGAPAAPPVSSHFPPPAAPPAKLYFLSTIKSSKVQFKNVLLDSIYSINP